MAKRWTEQDVLKIMALMYTMEVDSLNRLIGNDIEDERNELGTFIEDPGPGPQEIVEASDRIRLLNKVVEELSPREQRIIKLRYGLEDGQFKTLDEIGNMYGVTRERVRQVEMKAIKKLKWIIQHKYKLKQEDL